MILVLICLSSKTFDSCHHGMDINNIIPTTIVLKDVRKRIFEDANKLHVLYSMLPFLASASCKL